MNERIQALAEQCYHRYSEHHIDLEKFAELIVRECVAQIEIVSCNPYRNMGDTDEYGISACIESIRRIKEQFGVEE
jgi:hypothetical protein